MKPFVNVVGVEVFFVFYDDFFAVCGDFAVQQSSVWIVHGGYGVFKDCFDVDVCK